MTFTAYVKPLHEIIDDIADALIATADWEEGDATWDTSDTTLQNARRVVHHIADDVYLSLIMENGSQYNYSTSYYWRGLFLVFSSGWDDVAHEPDGSMYYTFAGYNGRSTSISYDLAKEPVDYRLYTGVDGFALVGVPAPSAYFNRQSSFIVVVERNTSKLYADGFTNFYMFVDGNYLSTQYNTYNTAYTRFGNTFKWWKYSHPFVLQSQTGWETPYDATLSRGDDLAYFAKPILHNDTDAKSPVFQAELFLMVDYFSKVGGLTDDDEIVMNGKKYQVTVKQSPDSAVYMEYGIKKAE